MNTLGDRLRKLRQEHESSPRQEDVAVSIGYSRATYANWELGRGEPDHDALRALARYYRCTTDYLLGLTDRPRLESPSQEIEDDSNITLAANNEDGYGNAPSPELRQFIRNIIQDELKKREKK
ncbi:HTH-type transcriptional regulator Xre [Peptococcaceae bacterium CEB3]|nr:HTH-type transcriptional regulator Xre [Peptococcaceae bacterium CEB3]